MKTNPILGKFSKGTAGSVSLNFSASATANCDDRCRHKNNGCYAEVLERRADRTQLLAKLKRHETMNPALVCGKAILEITERLAKGKSIPWLRISTDGSVPQPETIKPLFRTQLKALVKLCKDYGIPVHFPVESSGKASIYRIICGDDCVVRESLQTIGEHKTATGAVSWVAGDDIKTGTAIRERRIEAARTEAAERRDSTGRKTIVCPAVVAGFRAKTARKPANPLAKCGSCTACALATIDVVYPFH